MLGVNNVGSTPGDHGVGGSGRLRRRGESGGVGEGSVEDGEEGC
jgi:hypothetical protein